IQRDNEMRIGGPARTQSNNNLKQLSLALHSCNDVFKRLPPAFDSFGQINFPTSVHVHLLPFLESDPLYESYVNCGGIGADVTNGIIQPFLSPRDYTQRNNGAGYQNFAANLRVFSDKGINTSFDANMPALAGIEPGKATIPHSFADGTGNTIVFTTK